MELSLSLSQKNTMVTVKTLLSQYGYSVSKKWIEGSYQGGVKALKAKLTIVPKTNPNFPGSKEHRMFEEGKRWLRVPRRFGFDEFGPPDVDKLAAWLASAPRRESLEFSGQLREKQAKPRDVILSELKTAKTATLCLMTGSGKTVIAVSIVCDLKVRTCVIVNKTMLAEQWKKEIERFSPKANVKIVQGAASVDLLKDDTVDVCVTMSQTLTNVEHVDGVFGLLVVDECHHLPCRTFSDVMFKACSPMVLALSATPTRADGLSVALDWHVGPLTYREVPDRSEQKPTRVIIERFDPADIEFDPKGYSRMITRLCADPQRNEVIAAAATRLVDDPRRHVLVLTDRVSHARRLSEMIASRSKTVDLRDVGTFVAGGSTKRKRKRGDDDDDSPLKKRVIVSTYKMMEEGISVPSLNSLVLASPKKNVVQTVGRIYRKVHVDVEPVIVDVVDSILEYQAKTRMKTYKTELKGNFFVQTCV